MINEYYLGLDMGTNSVGWAVTDKKYNILRAKGKDLWGVRLFDEAETAEGRRGFRTARRRRQREQLRIAYLKEIFADEINKKDQGFYQRLEESKYFPEDKSVYQKYALFNDDGFTDKEYFKKYPTIFHLRKELIESKEYHDIRLVFLACLNIFKHRGHFLNENITGENVENFMGLYGELGEFCEKFDTDKDVEKIKEILSSRDYNMTDKSKAIRKIIDVKSNASEAKMIDLFCGKKVKLSVIFTDESYDEETKKFSISFRDGNFDDEVSEVEAILSEKNQDLFYLLKRIHDWGVLSDILGDYKYLSYARVDDYKKHAKDLGVLKRIYKKYIPEKFDAMFRIMDKDNYSAYVGSVNSEKEKIRRGEKTCKIEDLYKRIKKDLKDVPDSSDKKYILDEMDKAVFLPKQLTDLNGVIPYQLHLMELEKILENASMYLEFLNDEEVLDNGEKINNAEKIISLMKFRVPFYVGPLYKTDNNNAWVVRKEDGKVLPWNFHKKIDVEKCREKFIDELVSHCTYINNEKVLPKSSLLYEKFMVLNELNNLKIDGCKISIELKQELYKNLFIKGKKVTKKKLESYLKKEGYIKKSDKVIFEGIDGDFKNTCSNYAKFTAIFDTEILTYKEEQIAERIIYLASIFGESKKLLKNMIKEEFGEVLDDKQIKRICGIKFRDWARLSKEFLQLEGADRETGEIKTIIRRMWEENYNLMELLSNRFTYLDEIEARSSSIEKSLAEISFEDLEDLYISAPVRRMTWQTILILKELVKVIGKEPKRIFVEMAREHEKDSKRKDSRKKRLIELYKSCKKSERDWKSEIEGIDEYKFRSRKLYLYYTQMGRCMYTGEAIDLEDLFNNNIYDVDHIYPKHFIKDDSIGNNLVLVKKQKNAHKSDTYPIESSIREKNINFWRMLADKGFINKEKYKRLTRTTGFTDEEKAGFINRQIVETRQGTKFLAKIFKECCKDSELIYSKASNVSQFRHEFDLIKCREVNDYHHAHDAYLNIVVGNTYYVKFTKNPMNFIKEYNRDAKKNPYHMHKLFDCTVKRDSEIAWINEKDGSNNTIATVKKFMDKNSPIISMRNYEKTGGIADQNICNANKAKYDSYLPVKTSDEKLMDVKKYGGYTKLSAAYFFLVEHEKKGELIRTIEVMPIYKNAEIKTIKDMEDYCRDILKLYNPVIKYKKIKPYSLVKIDGFYYYLSGKTNSRYVIVNAVQLSVNRKYVEYIRKILKSLEKEFTESQYEGDEYISKEKNIALYKELMRKHLDCIYKNRKNPIGDKLCSAYEKFVELSIKDQIYIIREILNISERKNNGADLREIGGSKQTGVTTIGSKISEFSEFKLINRSVAGLYEETIDLLRV